MITFEFESFIMNSILSSGRLLSIGTGTAPIDNTDKTLNKYHSERPHTKETQSSTLTSACFNNSAILNAIKAHSA